MKKNKTKNPLIKRVPRELKGDWSKYLLVSLFMIFVIGFISGMYVANESMLTAATENTKKSICEDGHFELLQKAKKGVFDSLSATIYEDFYCNPFPINYYKNKTRTFNESSHAFCFCRNLFSGTRS